MALTPEQEAELADLNRLIRSGDNSVSDKRRRDELLALKAAPATPAQAETPTPAQQPAVDPTLLTTGAGTAFNPDLFAAGRIVVPLEAPYPPDYWVSDPVPVKEAGAIIGYIRKWQWIWYGAYGGLGVTFGSLARHHDRASAIESVPLDCRFPGYAMLPTLLSSTADPAASPPFAGLHHQNIFDTLIMGIGDGANTALAKETSSTDPTPTAITYSPGADTPISCLGAVTIGAATNAKRLIVGRQGAVAQIISDASGTVDASMHANSTTMRAIVQTILNRRPILAYCANSIYKWYVDSTATAAADETPWTNLPAGGYGLGLFRRGVDGPMRWYLVLPHTTSTTSILTFGSEKPGYVMSFDQEGLDPQELGPEDFLGIQNVYAACLWDRGIVVTDGKRVVVNRGDEGKEELGLWATRDLDPVAGNYVRSNFEIKVVGFLSAGTELLVLLNAVRASAASSGFTTYWTERYNSTTKSWHQTQNASVAGDFGAVYVSAPGSIPWSLQTNFLHYVADITLNQPGVVHWLRQYMPPPPINPFDLRQTAEAGTSTGIKFESTAAGIVRSPYLEIPNCQGWPKVVSRITRLGQNTGDPDGGSVRYDIGGVFASFSDVAPSHIRALVSDREPFPDNRSYFYQAQLKATVTQGTTTYMTANAAPVMVEGYCFIGMPPKPPRFIRDEGILMPPSPFGF